MVEDSLLDWIEDSQSFDTVAGLYDEFRPEYPEELVDSVIALSGLPEGGRILEIGSGTGKATGLFACRGYTIHCIEPGGNLAAVAAQNLKDFSRVTFENARFEQAQEHTKIFDLVISAQAFHWVDKETGYPKAARALKPGGHLALFWNMHSDVHGQIVDELERIYQEVAPEMNSHPKKDDEVVIKERADDITRSACFGPVAIRRFPWSTTRRTSEYVGLLNTYSDHLRLPERTRKRLFNKITRVIDRNGGSIGMNYVAVLYVAQKLS